VTKNIASRHRKHIRNFLRIVIVAELVQCLLKKCSSNIIERLPLI